MPSCLPLPVRRLLLPLAMVVLVVLAALFATATAIGLAVAPLTSRRRVLRLCAFALSYVLVELASLTAAAFLWIRHAIPGRARRGSQWMTANERLLGWALGRVLRAGQRCLGFEVLVDESSDTTALSEADPVSCSPGMGARVTPSRWSICS